MSCPRKGVGAGNLRPDAPGIYPWWRYPKLAMSVMDRATGPDR